MEWFSVKNALPKIIEGQPHSEDVLAFCVSDGEPTPFGAPNMYPKGETYMSIDRIVKWNDGHEPSFRADRFYGEVLYWMPLPGTPEENRKK